MSITRLNLPGLASAVVAVDIDRANIPDHGLLGDFTQEGQKHHFMLRQGLSQKDSLKECLEWIKTNTRDAARSIAHWPGGIDGAATRRGDDTFEQSATGSLAWALHAIQDSFSRAHVHRTDREVITRIFAWDKDNKDPGPRAKEDGAPEWDEARNAPGPGWKGHKAYDDAWKKDLEQVDYTRPHVQAAVDASAALLSLAFRAAMFSEKDPASDFEKSMTVFFGKHFASDFKE